MRIHILVTTALFRAGLAAGVVALAQSEAPAGQSAPLQIVATGPVSRCKLSRHADRLVVGGLLDRPSLPNAHVDILLLDGAGAVVAEACRAAPPLHPQTATSRNGRYRFFASFPIEKVQPARVVRVVGHSARHE